MKAMLSQPMAGKTDEEIVATREKAIKGNGRTRRCSDSVMLPCKIIRKHELLSCCILLQRLGERKRMQN